MIVWLAIVSKETRVRVGSIKLRTGIDNFKTGRRTTHSFWKFLETVMRLLAQGSNWNWISISVWILNIQTMSREPIFLAYSKFEKYSYELAHSNSKGFGNSKLRDGHHNFQIWRNLPHITNFEPTQAISHQSGSRWDGHEHECRGLRVTMPKHYATREIFLNVDWMFCNISRPFCSNSTAGQRAHVFCIMRNGFRS